MNHKLSLWIDGFSCKGLFAVSRNAEFELMIKEEILWHQIAPMGL